MFTNPYTTTAALSAYAIHDNARLQRLHHEHRKLTQTARNYILSHPNIVGLGDDPLVSQMLAAGGFAAIETSVMRIALFGTIITVICVPTRVWRDSDARSLLLQIRREVRDLRQRCLLVPQRWLRAGVRSAVARTIARARHTHYSTKQMNIVLSHLRSVRISTLAETAATLTDHDDPFGVILSMAASGYVKLDRSAPLHSGTWLAAPV